MGLSEKPEVCTELNLGNWIGQKLRRENENILKLRFDPQDVTRHTGNSRNNIMSSVKAEAEEAGMK
jgi:hypothetical protein